MQSVPSTNRLFHSPFVVYTPAAFVDARGGIIAALRSYVAHRPDQMWRVPVASTRASAPIPSVTNLILSIGSTVGSFRSSSRMLLPDRARRPTNRRTESPFSRLVVQRRRSAVQTGCPTDATVCLPGLMPQPSTCAGSTDRSVPGSSINRLRAGQACSIQDRLPPPRPAPLRSAAISPLDQFGLHVPYPRHFLFGYSFGRDSRPSRFARRRSPPRAACRANVAPHPSRRAIFFLMLQVFHVLISGCPCLLVLWFAQALTEAERRA